MSSTKIVHPWVGKGNLRRVWKGARVWERQAGEVYWQQAHERVKGMAELHDVHLNLVAAVFCVLSPNNSEKMNWLDAESMLAAGERAVVHSYPLNKAKALRMLAGEEPGKLLGKKTASMWANICTPADPWPVTIDGHMVSCWQGERLTMDQAGVGEKGYKVIAQGVRELAEEYGVGTAGQVQATLWLAWKRMNRILYNPQMKLELT